MCVRAAPYQVAEGPLSEAVRAVDNALRMEAPHQLLVRRPLRHGLDVVQLNELFLVHRAVAVLVRQHEQLVQLVFPRKRRRLARAAWCARVHE